MTAVQLDFVAVLFDDTKVDQKPVRRRAMQVRRYSADTLARYRGLTDIDPSEYQEFFPNTGKPWKAADVQYLCDWWGKDDALSLSYALGRPPWGLQRMICKLRKHGIEGIPYLHEQHMEDER